MRSRVIWAMFSCLFCLGWLVPLRPAHAQTCVTAKAARSFLQLWQAHAQYSPAQWDTLFARLDQHGFNEIIVQWSSYGTVSFLRGIRPSQETAECLPGLIAAARRAKCKLWLGLHFDPEFWQRIDKESEIAAYLDDRLRFFELSLPLLLSLVQTTDPSGDTVAGWYIADEIDDRNWQNPQRQILLLNYLAGMSSRLHTSTPRLSILISGFVNGAMTPDNWSALVKRILTETSVQVFLLQDAIGTGKMTVARLRPYLQALQQSVPEPASRFSIIVEIFSMRIEAGDSTQAGPFERIREQLELAAAFSGPPLLVFSAPDHLLDTKRPGVATLSKQWLDERSGCLGTDPLSRSLSQGSLLLLENKP